MADGPPKISVVMAVYKPDREQLRRQVASIRRQQAVDVQLHIFADGPMDGLDDIEGEYGGAHDVAVVRFAENRGPAETFISGMAHVLQRMSPDRPRHYIAFADQDDDWDRDKLAASAAALEQAGVSMVHTDARLVDRSGAIVAESMFAYEGRAKAPSIEGLFFRNSVTGMTMMIDRDTAQRGIILREQRPGLWLHDHFLAVIASAANGVALIDRPLVCYVQHGNNVVGAFRPRHIGARLASVARHLTRKDVWSKRYLEEGRRFIDALVTIGGPDDAGFAAASRLQQMLNNRGPKALWRTMLAYRRVGFTNLILNQLLLYKFNSIISAHKTGI